MDTTATSVEVLTTEHPYMDEINAYIERNRVTEDMVHPRLKHRWATQVPW